MTGSNLLFLFFGIIIGMIIMTCIASSGRKNFEEEFYRNNKK